MARIATKLAAYLFIAEPFGFEIVAVGNSEREARGKAFSMLTEEERDNCECLDCVEHLPLEFEIVA